MGLSIYKTQQSERNLSTADSELLSPALSSDPLRVMMKPFVKLLFAAALASTVLAQQVSIGYPPAKADVIAGSTVVVQVVEGVRALSPPSRASS